MNGLIKDYRTLSYLYYSEVELVQPVLVGLAR